MAKTEQDDGALGAVGECPWQKKNVLCHGPGIGRDCTKCGWNPTNDVQERRVAEAMREYHRKVSAGKIKPAIW